MTNTHESSTQHTDRYPPADITPSQFETYVLELFSSVEESGGLTNLRVQNHEVITAADGSYDFDATVRYELAGMNFLVLVEAKKHKNSIKREVVQILHQKVQSVGAHKGVIVSTAPFQQGALDFALNHGIALVTVTEGRFTYETKSAEPVAAPSREEANEWFDLPTFVGHAYSRGQAPGSLSVTLMSPEYPEYVLRHLLPEAPDAAP